MPRINTFGTDKNSASKASEFVALVAVLGGFESMEKGNHVRSK
jgi:hypothetical protein